MSDTQSDSGTAFDVEAWRKASEYLSSRLTLKPTPVEMESASDLLLAYAREIDRLRSRLVEVETEDISHRLQMRDTEMERLRSHVRALENVVEAAREHLDVCSRALGVQAPLRSALARLDGEGKT